MAARKSTSRDKLEIFRAREHNLNIDHLDVPKGKLVVFTGVSGSGKSSLAFDTLYAEGQRRYVESLSAYARQFLGRLDRPNVERIRGLSPTIAIEQKSASNNPRSTVGTITEIWDYLRVLYARAGQQHCHVCGKEVRGRTPSEVVDDVFRLPEGERLLVLAPVVIHRKGEFRELLGELQTRGFLRVRIDGVIYRLDEVPALDKKRKHSIDLVIDRVQLSERDRRRLTESVELGLREGKGEVRIEDVEGSRPALVFSESRSCCGSSFPELSPQSFSFNSPLGMCPSCNGLGSITDVTPELVIPDWNLSIRQGAIRPWANAMERESGWRYRTTLAMAEAIGLDLDRPFKKLTPQQRQQVMYGLDKKIRVTWGEKHEESQGSWAVRFEGVINLLRRRYKETQSEAMREKYNKFLSVVECSACGGRRLRAESLAVRVADRTISEVSAMTVATASQHFARLRLSRSQAKIAEGVLREVRSRLAFLLNVGLDYLTLDRPGPTLSGGEAQRIRLASQLGSELSGVMYVLDEPSIGLHPRDNSRLIRTLQGLRDVGNSVIVVEHDEETIRAADHVVDFGPGAGHLGGQVVFSGTTRQLLRDRNSLTGAYLSGREAIAIPKRRRPPSEFLHIHGASENNLRNIDVKIPLETLVAVTGVSGAGKSSLVNGILLPALMRKLHGSQCRVGPHRAIDGLEHLDKVIAIDQKPIGRTPRSNPGTYTKAFDEIREIFAQLPEARALGWSAGRFSFNVKGGRCEACCGEGMVRVEMHFLSDVWVPCEVCKTKRYNAQTLGVRYRGHNIADVLERSVEEAIELFSAYPKLNRILGTLVDVGLGYIKIGQPAPTLSGGEAQRVKLSRELGKRETGRTLYILDEPTTGLHFDDIRKLLDVLHRLVAAGNSVLVVEHNLDVIKSADWIIDLGPDGGHSGGQIIAVGPPEKIAKSRRSHTGQSLQTLIRAL